MDGGIALTADADGQHAFLDIIRVNEVARANPDALTLGCRAFRGDVPLRSRLGNALTRQVFAIVGALGTALVSAALPTVLEAGIPHMYPGAPTKLMYEPWHKLKFSLAAPTMAC